MKQISIFITAILLFYAPATHAQSILYVDKKVTGGNESGDSWGNAMPELADALITAAQNYPNVKQIRVAL